MKVKKPEAPQRAAMRESTKGLERATAPKKTRNLKRDTGELIRA